MRERLGPFWNGGDALLDRALAHDDDDLTSAPRYQDPLFLRVHEIRSRYSAWGPFATIAAGTQQGGRAWLPHSSPGYILIKADSEVRLSGATDTPGVRWKILRIR